MFHRHTLSMPRSTRLWRACPPRVGRERRGQREVFPLPVICKMPPPETLFCDRLSLRPGQIHETVETMKSETMYFALNAIRLEARKLLQEELSPEGQKTVELIISLARYGKDVRDTHCGSDPSSAEQD